MMRCTMGTSPAKLTVLPIRTVNLTGPPMANISDHKSMVNLAPFGLCRSLGFPPTAAATAAAHGHLTPMPCMHNTPTPWFVGKMDYLIKGQPALLKSCKCQCMWGGTISLVTDGQVGEGTQWVQKKQEEDFELQQEDTSGLDQNSVLDGIQLALDAAGFAPGVGAIPDLINASISALRGNWADAGLSLLAAVPLIGDAAAGVKIARKGVKAAAKATKAAKTAKASSKIEKVAKGKKLVTRDPVTKRIVNKSSKIKGTEGFNPSTATNLEKGNYGEILSHNNKVNNPLLKEKGYDLERIGKEPPSGLADKGHQGIDGIYKTKTEPPKYVIDEAKYGSSQLGKLKDGTKQMSDPWIFGSNRLSNSVGDIEAAKIEKAFKQNRVDRVLSQIDEYGNVTTYRLNNEGKIIGPWP